MTEEQRNEYMKRLKHEYQRFMGYLFTSETTTLIDTAQHIVNMKYAYDYLRSKDISDDELEYIMQAEEPIKEVACAREAMDEVSYFENPMALTVYDIHDKDLFNDPEVNKYTGKIPIRFHRKVNSIEEIEGFSRLGEDDKFQIERIIEMRPAEFERYADNILSRRAFIAENSHLMRLDKNDVWHCILVKDMGSERGILVESDGYDYARYSAYVRDTRALDFQNIPVEEYPRTKDKQRKKSRRQER